ncbi:polysaccharide deacetylase family protein [Histidinibacterium aquaticum]|uniref:DUF2194 domain-containing protein n=1 Tax=Histidinibacterium aquaticum TaxID=2613962 RepID=A0A5J5GPD9_9RHOB|nr:hypothetical protein [Histidinibacterium aquaticum]KAA9009438.1 hypothetical protein F3S47_09355 [Histidinibacterium aquaticum]
MSEARGLLRFTPWVISLAWISIYNCAAAETPPDPLRRVLALYDGRFSAAPDETAIHEFLEFPANHLGLQLVYHDVATGLPEPFAPGGIRYVATWFDEAVPNPEAYSAWVRREMESGRRFAVFSEQGADLGGEAGAEEMLRMLGGRYHGYVDATHTTLVAEAHSEWSNFETGLDPTLPPYPIIETEGEVIPLLTLSRGDRTSTVAFVGPSGSFVASGYEQRVVPETEASVWFSAWFIDPFAVLEAAFDLPLRPIPDTTTVSGRRIFFSHVDGDGWNNLSRVPSEDGRPRLSAEVLLTEILLPFSDLPVSIGLVGGDVDPACTSDDEAETLARQIFQLDHVEVAAHGYTHPFKWEQFDDVPDPPDPVPTFQEGARHTPSEGVGALTRSWLAGTASADQMADCLELDPHAPRAFSHVPFDLELEIKGALDVATSLAPPGKPAKLFLWTGDARPFEAALRMAREAGVLNMNGGDSRFDAWHPSITNLSPLARTVGQERQIYAPNSNEAAYTDLWQRDHFGQLQLLDTVRRTEFPRRLKPYNLYYHTYSAERRAGLAALRTLLEEARSGDYIAIRASEYAAIANDFFRVRVEPLEENLWQVSDRGRLQTVRFDGADDLVPDLARSRGVLGARQINGSLYIALDAEVPTALVALSEQPVDGLVMLEQASWQVRGLQRHDCGFELTAEGFGDGEMTWTNVPWESLSLLATRNGRTLWTGTVAVQGGEITFELPIKAIEPVRILATCPAGEE